jgi:AraC-like DNA-binding protein
MKDTLQERQARMRERQEKADGPVPDPVETPYTVAEVAKMTGFSPQTVTRIFEHERGVVIYEEKRPRKRASYRTIRIPRHVYRRVIQKWTIQ